MSNNNEDRAKEIYDTIDPANPKWADMQKIAGILVGVDMKTAAGILRWALTAIAEAERPDAKADVKAYKGPAEFFITSCMLASVSRKSTISARFVKAIDLFPCEDSLRVTMKGPDGKGNSTMLNLVGGLANDLAGAGNAVSAKWAKCNLTNVTEKPPADPRYAGTDKKSKREIAFENHVLADDHVKEVKSLEAEFDNAKDLLSKLGKKAFGTPDDPNVAKPKKTKI